jgi:hypothetical protein
MHRGEAGAVFPQLLRGLGEFSRQKQSLLLAPYRGVSWAKRRLGGSAAPHRSLGTRPAADVADAAPSGPNAGGYHQAGMSSTTDLRHPAPEGMQQVPLDEKAGYPPPPAPTSGVTTPSRRPGHPRLPSWDMLAGPGSADFDVRNNGIKHLEFAEGDAGTNKFSRLYYYLVTRSIVSRWIIFIVPILAVRLTRWFSGARSTGRPTC